MQWTPATAFHISHAMSRRPAQHHTLIRTFWPINVTLIILYAFIQRISTCSFNQSDPAFDPIAYHPVRACLMQPRASYICSLLHLTIQAHTPNPQSWTPYPRRRTPLQYHCSQSMNKCRFSNDTILIGNMSIHLMLARSLIFFVIKIWTVEFIFPHWNHRNNL